MPLTDLFINPKGIFEHFVGGNLVIEQELGSVEDQYAVCVGLLVYNRLVKELLETSWEYLSELI